MHPELGSETYTQYEYHTVLMCNDNSQLDRVKRAVSQAWWAANKQINLGKPSAIRLYEQ